MKRGLLMTREVELLLLFYSFIFFHFKEFCREWGEFNLKFKQINTYYDILFTKLRAVIER